MKTLNEFLECKVDFYSYEGGRFIYTYKSKGEDVKIEVSIVDGENDIEFHVNGKSIGLTTDVDFIGCEDLEDCCLVIAKRLIKDNDSEVNTTFLNDQGITLTEVFYNKILNKNLEYVTEEESWTLHLRCGYDYNDITSFTSYVIDEEDIDKVLDFFETEDTDNLQNYLFDLDDEIYEVYNLWGDDDCERLLYEVLNENNEEVDSGDLLVSERNVFKYEECQNIYMVSRKNHPKYLVIHQDTMKRSSSTFSVPKNFQVGGIHFIDSLFIENYILDWDYFGDTMTRISSFKYCGKEYVNDDIMDAGSYGSNNWGLFKWDEENNRYELIKEIQ